MEESIHVIRRRDWNLEIYHSKFISLPLISNYNSILFHLYSFCLRYILEDKLYKNIKIDLVKCRTKMTMNKSQNNIIQLRKSLMSRSRTAKSIIWSSGRDMTLQLPHGNWILILIICRKWLNNLKIPGNLTAKTT